MPTVPTVADVQRAKQNLDAYDDVINGDEGSSVTTPGGQDVDTLKRAIATLKAFNFRGPWAQSTAYALKDVVSDPDDLTGPVYVRVNGGTSPGSGTFQDEYDSGNGPWRIFQGLRDTVADVAALKLRPGSFDREFVELLGYYVTGVGGGPIWWDSASTETPDDGRIFQVTGVPTGRYKRPVTYVANPADFGAAEDGTTDDTDAFEAIVDAGILDLRLNMGKSYKLTRTLNLPEGFNLRGLAHSGSATNSLSGNTPRLLWRPAGADTTCIRNVSGERGQVVEDLIIDIDDTGHCGIAWTNSNHNVTRRVKFTGTFDIGMFVHNTFSCDFDEISTNGATAKRACIYANFTNATTFRRIYTSTLPAEVGTRMYGIALNTGFTNTIELPIMQGPTVGISIGGAQNTTIINPYYENVLCNLITGATGQTNIGTVVMGGNFGRSYDTHPQWASRGPLIYMPATDFISFFGISFGAAGASDPDLTGFLSALTTGQVSIHSARFFGSSLRQEFQRVSGATPGLVATGNEYGSSNAQELILKADGVFNGTSYGIRVNGAGVLSTVEFTPTVWGGTLSSLLSDAMPIITSV